MTFTATPQPSNVPPRVRLDLNTDDPTQVFSNISVKRDGKAIRQEVFAGSSTAVGFDYEAPFGVPVTYKVEGFVLPATTADWTEAWANLTAWTGSGFTVSGGRARSTVVNAAIVRSATGVIQRLDVTDPSYVRVELLDASNAVVASVQVDANVTASGSSVSSATGGGSFTATLVNGMLSVAGSTWSTNVPYAGIPTKVRVVGLGYSYPATLTIPAGTGTLAGIFVDASGNIFAAFSGPNLVRKFDATGTLLSQFTPSGGASLTALAGDASGNLFLTFAGPNTIRKYDSTGALVASFSPPAGASIRGIATDSSGRVYAPDPTTNRVLRYTNALATPTDVGHFSGGSPYGLSVDSANSLYVVTSSSVRKYLSGSTTSSLTVTPASFPVDVDVDAGGNILVACMDGNIYKYDSTGALVTQFALGSQPQALALDASGNAYVADIGTASIIKGVATASSIGQVVETPAVALDPFSATVTTTLTVAAAWLIHPSQPSLSIPIDFGPQGGLTKLRFIEASSGESKTSAAQSTVHRPVGRRRPIVITAGPRQADEWTLTVGAPTIVQKNAVRAIVDDQTPLLLRFPPGQSQDLPEDWYSVGDVEVSRVQAPVLNEMTLIKLPLTPVDQPIVRQGALWTYGTGLLANPTYADSLAASPTYLDRLAGPS